MQATVWQRTGLAVRVRHRTVCLYSIHVNYIAYCYVYLYIYLMVCLPVITFVLTTHLLVYIYFLLFYNLSVCMATFLLTYPSIIRIHSYLSKQLKFDLSVLRRYSAFSCLFQCCIFCVTDINECLLGSNCRHHCQNTEGSYMCTCNEGYKLADDG